MSSENRLLPYRLLILTRARVKALPGLGAEILTEFIAVIPIWKSGSFIRLGRRRLPLTVDGSAWRLF